MRLLKARSSLFVMKQVPERGSSFWRDFFRIFQLSVSEISACGNQRPVKNGCSRLQFLLLLKILNLSIVWATE